MLRAYLRLVPAMHPGLTAIRLLCKAPLVPLYAGVGFQEVGPSPVVHGSEPWIEMVLEVEES